MRKIYMSLAVACMACLAFIAPPALADEGVSMTAHAQYDHGATAPTAISEATAPATIALGLKKLPATGVTAELASPNLTATVSTCLSSPPPWYCPAAHAPDPGPSTDVDWTLQTRLSAYHHDDHDEDEGAPDDDLALLGGDDGEQLPKAA